MLNFEPWKLSVNLGTFERVTGYTIKWLEIKDSFKAAVALANQEVELVISNSADMARVFSRRVGARLVFIAEENDNSEALVVHKKWHVSNGGPIRSPRDLIGRRVHVWYGSTAHYSLVSLFEEMQVPVLHDTTYQMYDKCTLRPCHYTTNPDAVTLISADPHIVEQKWDSGEIIATFIGLPELSTIKQKG